MNIYVFIPSVTVVAAAGDESYLCGIRDDDGRYNGLFGVIQRNVRKNEF